MAVEIKWTTLALQDIENIAGFIAKDSARYASIQAERFFERVTILETQTEIGGIVPELGQQFIRQLFEGSYSIIYEVTSPKRITVLTIHHRSRLLSNNPLFEK